MGKYLLLIFFVMNIAELTTTADDILSKHLPYNKILETAQQKLNSAINRPVIKQRIFPSVTFSPEVDKTTFFKTAIDKLLETTNNASILSREICMNQTMATLFAMGQGQEWALRMFDAVDKLPSGILDGNTKFYGSYDECLKIKSNINNSENAVEIPQYEGRYCWAQIYVNFQMLRGIILDTGVCMPDVCSSADTQTVLSIILSLINIGEQPLYAIGAQCQEKTPEIDARAIAMLTLCAFFGSLLICGTAYDVLFVRWYNKRQKAIAENVLKNTIDLESSNMEKKPLLGEKSPVSELFEPGIPGQLLLAFSVYTNGAKLLNTNTPAGTLTSINGIRFLSMSWVILGHTFAFGIGQASNVNVFFPEVMARWTFQAVSNALLSVDSFFAMSGLLVSYLALKEMKKKDGRINWAMFYFHRFWRLTPPYMLILGVYVSLNRYWSDGPIWRTDGMEDNYCIDTWWKNLLYVNNVVDNNKQCFGWAWYLANDMQFYILSPLMFVPLYFFNGFGLISSSAFLLATFITTYFISSNNKLSPGLFGGADEKATGDYMSDYYFMPYCRIGPYVVGVITGYLLYRANGKLKIHWALNLFGWAIATVLGVTVLYGLRDSMNGHPLSVEVSALFNATHRSVWGACLCWVIFACATGNGGYINTLLSWEGFSTLSRLTYCAYLVHPIVMYTYYQSLRGPIYYTDMEMIVIFLAFLVGSMMVAFVASLMFESPMMGLEKVIFRREKKS